MEKYTRMVPTNGGQSVTKATISPKGTLKPRLQEGSDLRSVPSGGNKASRTPTKSY